tara:strand:+ start:138 stop:1532 length:1395 start_codon:yes stop_codon:yes gene_type:complete
MPLILGTNSIKDTGYNVANSLRFNSGSSDRLTRSFSAGSSSLWTWSGWIKRSKLGSRQSIFTAFSDSSNVTRMEFTANDELKFNDENGGNTNGRIVSSAKYRDPSAWMHIVFHWDSSDSTSADRLRMFVNNVRVTDFSDTGNAPSTTSRLNTAITHELGSENNGTFFEGYMAEVVFINGANLDPDQFGEYDEDSPTIWKPKDVSGLTFGTTGFYLDFEDSSALGNDVSGNNNDWSVSNLTSTDQSTDTCTNNFCTLNPLSFDEGTLSEGNLEIDQNGSAGRFCASTFQVTKGKWYYEAKILNYGSDPRPSLGVGRNEETYTGNAHQGASSIVYGLENAAVFKGNTSVFSHDSSPSSGDIYGVAFDLDNLKIYFHKNGTYFNSGDPANGTGNVTTLVSGTDYSPITGALNTSSNSARNNDWQFNFGSPPYSVSSGNSDAEGFGNFEHSVPSGFFSLCSKNLAEYG